MSEVPAPSRDGGPARPSELAVPLALSGERVDRAVATLTGRSRSSVAAAIERGDVLLDGEVVRARATKVAAGSVLLVPPEPPPAPLVAEKASGTVAFTVVHEDADLLVIDKPAGVVVHPGAGHRNDTLVSGLVASYPDLLGLEGFEANRPGIVHRLDKDTSGLLVVARSEIARVSLLAQLREHAMGREYLALVLGRLPATSGVIDAPIGRSRRDRVNMAVTASGRGARTHYELIEELDTVIEASLLRVRLETGRTHQIRVHLSAIGHPVAGDVRYGGGAPSLGLRRPFLHAARLSLVHPATGEAIEWASELPKELSAVLGRARSGGGVEGADLGL